MDTIREQDVRRRLLYQNFKRVRTEDEEIAYNEFDGYEIITTYTKTGTKEFWWKKPDNARIGTYRWFGNANTELLQQYTSIEEAKKGHQKWCQKEFVC